MRLHSWASALTKGPRYANNTRPAAGFQMSHCSPAGSCLEKSLWLPACVLHSPFSPFTPSLTAKILEWHWKGCNMRGRRGGGTKWVMSWLTSHCCLLTCVISALPRSLAWDTERLPAYNLLPGTNDLCKYTNQLGDIAITTGTLALPSGVGWHRLNHNQGWRAFEVGKCWVQRPGCHRLFTCFAFVAMTNAAKCTWL